MKLPVLKNPPLCYTFEQWAYRMAISQLVSFITIAGILIWLTTFLKENSTDNTAGINAALIPIIVLCFFPVIFSIVLLVGLGKDNTTVLLVWIIYGLIGTVVWTAVTIGVGIYLMTLDATNGIIIIILGVVIGGHMFYSVMIINTIRAKLLEKNIQKT